MRDDEKLVREQLDRTEKLNAQLAFENERLRKVLKPLASWAEQYDERVYPPDNDSVKVAVPIGELRAALSALKDQANG